MRKNHLLHPDKNFVISLVAYVSLEKYRVIFLSVANDLSKFFFGEFGIFSLIIGVAINTLFNFDFEIFQVKNQLSQSRV